MWPVALSGRLPVEALVGHHPTNKLIGRDPIPCRKSFPRIPCGHLEHPALPPVSRSYSGAWGRLVTHYSPVRHSHPGASARDPVRLACVKHAASVHPEPESNPPQKTFMKSIRTDDSQNKKSTSTSLRKDALKKPHPSSNPPGYPTTTQAARRGMNWQSLTIKK